MRYRNLAGFGAALVVGAICGSLIGPRPAAAVAREIIELQRDVTSLLQGQKDIGMAKIKQAFETLKAQGWTEEKKDFGDIHCARMTPPATEMGPT